MQTTKKSEPGQARFECIDEAVEKYVAAIQKPAAETSLMQVTVMDNAGNLNS